MTRTLFFILFFLSCSLLHAQRETESQETLPVLYDKDSVPVGELDLKNFRFTPFLAPSVSPEVGLMLVGGGLISFKLDQESKVLQTSSIPFSFGYSTNGSANLNVRPAIFFKGDKHRII